MQRWMTHPLVFAVVAATGTAAILAWALFGRDGVEAVHGAVLLVAALGLRALRAARILRRVVRRFTPVKPEDRARRLAAREHRRAALERRRRAREGAMRRYGSADSPGSRTPQPVEVRSLR